MIPAYRITNEGEFTGKKTGYLTEVNDWQMILLYYVDVIGSYREEFSVCAKVYADTCLRNMEGRSMKPTDILKHEHELILVMLQILDTVCARIEEGEKVNTEHLADMIDFIKNFADRCHHAKEERILFPELKQTGIGQENGPIGVMLAEHAEGRFFVKGMDEALKELKEGDGVAAGRFIADAGGYVKLLDGHIMKENNILFRMADERLSDSQQKAMLKEFDRVESEEIGEGVHEKYHEMLHRLRDIYLPATS